jgi:thiamine-phosphate pyrophosphorylase
VRLYLCAPATDRAVLETLVRGGVDVVQLRDATLGDEGIRRAAEAFRGLGVPFILNDRPDLARAVGADGVHVGQDDATPADARALLGAGAIIGQSTHDPEQGARAAADPDVSYLSIGPVWATPTKPGRPAAGLDYVRWAAEHVDKPWFAIGGIGHGNVADVVAAGARRIVAVRALLEAPERAGELRAALDA